MAGGSGAGGPEILEVSAGRARGRGGRPPSGVRRWLPALALAGLAAVIVGAGLLGPKRDEAPSPDRATPSPLSSGGPAIAAVPPPTVRAGGLPLDDPWILLSGEWIDLATATRGAATGCDLERPITLAGGRTICVVDMVLRGPDLAQTVHSLSAITIGHVRTAAKAPPPTDPPAPALAPVPLAKLSGRSDIATGDPVAIAVAPAREPDVLLLAWAVLGDDGGYRVGLDRYRIDDDRTVLVGTRQVAAVPVTAATGSLSLGDLAVVDAPDDRAALVGFTIFGPDAATWRQLALVPVTTGRATGALGPPLALPAMATANAAPGAQTDDGVVGPCGGALGEGWATASTIFVICRGRPSSLRRLAVGGDAVGEGWPATGGALAARTIDEIALAAMAPSDPVFLAGNGVAIDRARNRYYRWSPLTRTLSTIDLAAPAGTQPAAGALVFDAAGAGPGTVDPARNGLGEQPVLAFDAGRDRLYLLAPSPGGVGTTVEVVQASTIARVASWAVSPEPFATIALSPDHRLLYVATGPRGFARAPSPLVAVEVLDTADGNERLYDGWLPAGGDPPGAAIAR